MPRAKAIVPNRNIHTTIPEDIAQEIDTLLYSDGLQCVPRGAFQDLLITLLRKFLTAKALDLAPFVPCLPGHYIVEGDFASIANLTLLLKGNGNGDS